MEPKKLLLVLWIFIVVFMIAIGIFLFRDFRKEKKQDVVIVPSASVDSRSQSEDTAGRQKQINLYFISPDGMMLINEPRIVIVADGLLESLKAALQELIKGPSPRASLIPPLPPTLKVRNIFLSSGTVYIDFSNELLKDHPGGTSGEMFAVLSLSRTLRDISDEINGIIILVDGREIKTIGKFYNCGHIDISNAVRPVTLKQLRIESGP